MICSYAMHALQNTPNTLLPTLYQRYTPVSNNPPCGTHLYRVNRYVMVLTTVLPNMQLLLYATDRPIFTTTLFLFLLQGVF
jgi:hypothetical protein